MNKSSDDIFLEITSLVGEYLPSEVLEKLLIKIEEFDTASKQELLRQSEPDPIEDDIKEDNKQRYADMKYFLRNCE